LKEKAIVFGFMSPESRSFWGRGEGKTDESKRTAKKTSTANSKGRFVRWGTGQKK